MTESFICLIFFFCRDNIFQYSVYFTSFICHFQDKPQPPPEGRLPDATKGRYLIFTTIAMNAYIHHLFSGALLSNLS